MELFKEFNYINEGIALLNRLGKGIPVREQFQQEIRKYINNSDSLFKKRKSLMSLYDKIEKAALKEFKNDSDCLFYYFGSLENAKIKNTFGQILFLWDEYCHPDIYDLDEFSRYILDMEEAKYQSDYSDFVQFLGNTFKDSGHVVKCNSPEDAFRIILESDLSSSEKQKFIDGLINRRQHLEKCLAILQRTIKVLMKFQEDINHHYQVFVDYWNNKFQGKDPLDYFKTLTPALDALNYNPLGIVIAIEFFNPSIRGFSLDMDPDTGEYTTPYYTVIGVLYCDEYPLTFSSNSDKSIYTTEYWLNILKQMSDRNRFEILAHIKDQPSFGNELASLLNLTTATVSHHTSLLNSAELINFSQEGARIYYSSNQETIRNCIQYIKDELL